MHKVSILIHISRSSVEREFPKQDRPKLAVDGIPFTGDVAQCKTPVVFWLKIWERCFGPSGQVCA